MQDIQLYEQLLGLSGPWAVVRVTMKREAQEIEVEVRCLATVWGCPTCGKQMQGHGQEERRWRHLDSCQFKTLVVCAVPRVRCLEHGTQQVAVPWAERRSRFTRLFERLAMDVLLECSVLGAGELLGISWAEADGIKQRAVARGLARKPVSAPARLCVDEKSAGRGQNYLTIVASVAAGRSATLEYVGAGRKRETLDAYWQSLTPAQRIGVEAVGMDLGEPFFNSTLAHVPGAANKIVHDPFHLVSYMNAALNEVRKAEHRSLLEAGQRTLSGSKQLWLYGEENLPAERAAEFARLKGQKLQTSRAWAIKELFRDFWDCESVAEGRHFFRRWYDWAIRSRLEPVKKVARMFQRHLDNIVTCFQHRLSNGSIAGLNNKIQSLVKKACGYRNPERFKTDIFFHLGGLNLYPSPQ
jgi:transposase